MQKLKQYPQLQAEERRFWEWHNGQRRALATPGQPDEDHRERKIAIGACANEERTALRQMAEVERSFKKEWERWNGVPPAPGVKPHLTNPHATASRFAEAAILAVDAGLSAMMAVQLLEFPTWVSCGIGVAATLVVYKTVELVLHELVVADQSKPKSALADLKRILRWTGFLWLAAIGAMVGLLPRFSDRMGDSFELVKEGVLGTISFSSPILAAAIEVITNLRSSGNEHALVYGALQHRLDAIARLRSEFSLPSGNSFLIRGEGAD